ncbi:MAG: sigma-54-dependent Fis family transcriptional regulator [Planctomycetota bacterium]|nr:MAG: sigma-54-dependent Fis family transcriptional regulator [Planctomycetota bacterium]
MANDAPMNLLVVEDDDQFREMSSEWMKRKGHRVESAANAQEALKRCERQAFDVVIADMNMPGLSGLELLQRLKTDGVESEVIILTGQATVQTAVEAMKLGACDYLTKPFPLSELEHRCRQAAERGRLRRENANLKTIIELHRPTARIVGDSVPMKELFRLIERVGPTDKTVLIQGESGTGKELVARAIQKASLRAEKPFVTINCAALPEQLVESELFGHEKGSFTGAVATKPGLFEVADGGTLFIDEIGELPGSLQPKLLRVLEDGSMRRVGSALERRVNVRIIAATNRNLEQEVQQNRFREDLFYRINVLSLVLPSLRERADDIPLLIQHFLPQGWRITDEARNALEKYRWPGNVRQLSNVIERATILADDQVVSIDDLPRDVLGQTPAFTARTIAPAAQTSRTDSGNNDDSDTSLASIERAHVLDVLKSCQGNKARAARALGIHRRKLYRLLERFHSVEAGDGHVSAAAVSPSES